MIRLSDLGIAEPKSSTPKGKKADPASKPARPVNPFSVPGSTAARALLSMWSNENRGVIVLSPPGAGKSTLIANIVRRLMEDPLVPPCSVMAVSNIAAMALSKRLVEVMGEDQVMLMGSRYYTVANRPDVPGLLFPERDGSTPLPRIMVRTVASAKRSYAHGSEPHGIAIIDEACQVTFADAIDAASSYEQVMLVGDPGQIGPVVPHGTRYWDQSNAGAPHEPSTTGFIKHFGDEMDVLNLEATYRLGQRTVDVIAPLYDFSFESRRPDCQIGDLGEIETMELPATDRHDDPASMRKVAEHARSLIGQTMTYGAGSAQVGAEDVCVIAARKSQTVRLRAYLNSMGLPDVTVDTADAVQGGQWAAVVAVDPLLGADTPSGHSVSKGRLTVMLSRHFGHLTWVYAKNWRSILEDPSSGKKDEDLALQASVRDSLIG